MSRMTRRAFLAAGAPLWADERRFRKGAHFQSEVVKFADSLTERQVFRLTSPQILHHLPHYHNRFISHGNDFLLVASEAPGDRQIFQLRPDDGRMMQLTEGPGVHPYSPSLGARDRWFFVLQGDTLKQIDVRNAKERKVYSSPAGWRMTGHLAITEEGRYAAFIEMRSSDWVEGFEQQFEKKPRCRVRVVENKSGKNWIASEEDQWLSHPQFRPRSTEILYSHEGPWHKVDGRLRLVGLQGEKPRNLRPREAGEGLGHEFWEITGLAIYYLFYPDESGRGATVRRLDYSSGKEESVSRCTSYGWMQGNEDDSVMVGASRSLAGPNIYLLFTRLQREFTVCEHASSGKPYPMGNSQQQDRCASWPEPVFSHDSQWIYFTTDREGKPAIYRLNVSDIVERT